MAKRSSTTVEIQFIRRAKIK